MLPGTVHVRLTCDVEHRVEASTKSVGGPTKSTLTGDCSRGRRLRDRSTTRWWNERGTGNLPVVRQADKGAAPKLTFYQRMVLREIRRRAKKRRGEPLSPEDWTAMFELNKTLSARAIKRIWRALPSSPRCGMCSAPFAGPGRFVVRPLGYRPSRKNPTLCATCVEASPPGGTMLYAGVLFADLRGFTSRAEITDAAVVAALLRRFYGCAERVFFPEAIIDKVVGDQVMALYLPDVQRRIAREQVPELMVKHAFELRAVGYGSSDGPFT